MEMVSRFLAFCGESLHLATSGPVGLPAALFLAGLAGSALHCVGMCGPFVLGQVMAEVDGSCSRNYGEWRRLAGAALVPYHLGRATTYTALGAAAGALTAVFASTADFAWLSAVLLVTAALLLIAQAFGLAIGTMSAPGTMLARLAGPLSASRSVAGRYGLGIVLGFLPCGLLYGALAAAAGSGSGTSGAVAMFAFSLGTMPALIAVGWGGLLLRRRLRDVARWIAAPVLIANALLMLVLAGQRI